MAHKIVGGPPNEAPSTTLHDRYNAVVPNKEDGGLEVCPNEVMSGTTVPGMLLRQNPARTHHPKEIPKDVAVEDPKDKVSEDTQELFLPTTIHQRNHEWPFLLFPPTQ
ncbi:MAG TPA: hypothetical protein VJB70_01735 [Candidatus Paceibacterota bacterium]